jgi:FlaA1/EpsC-like NDP-sugar epimerase
MGSPPTRQSRDFPCLSGSLVGYIVFKNSLKERWWRMSKAEKNMIIGISAVTIMIMITSFAIIGPYNEVLILASAIKVIFALAFMSYLVLSICRRLYRLCRDDNKENDAWNRSLLAVISFFVGFASPMFIIWINCAVNGAVNDLIVMV